MSAATTGTSGALTLAEYDALVSAGTFEGRRVELLEGEVRERVAKSPAHRGAVVRLQQWLTRQIDAGGVHVDGRPLREVWAVVGEQPFAMGDSEPEPDVALALAAGALSLTEHPSWARLVIEVAATSRREDLGRKPAIYAAAGVPDYWVVDLRRGETLMYSRLNVRQEADPGVSRLRGPRDYGEPVRRPFEEVISISVPDVLRGVQRRTLALCLADLLT